MKFSFIVATYKRNRELENCLASIEKVYLRKKKYEVEAVVVFQAGEQPLENMAQRFSAFGKFHCIQGKGLAKARNYAVKTSTGDIFIFLDDDAEIKEDFVEILAEHAQNNETGAFSGRILEKQTNRCFAECFNDTRVKRLRCRDFKYFMGSAHVFRKEVFVKIGFYDEAFGSGAKYAGAEETDMFFRAQKKGVKILYIPELVFFHPITGETSADKVFSYSHAFGAMCAKQMFSDWKRLPVYMCLLSKIFLKSLIRVCQLKIFPKSIEEKNARFKYESVMFGITKGVLSYMGERE